MNMGCSRLLHDLAWTTRALSDAGSYYYFPSSDTEEGLRNISFHIFHGPGDFLHAVGLLRATIRNVRFNAREKTFYAECVLEMRVPLIIEEADE